MFQFRSPDSSKLFIRSISSELLQLVKFMMHAKAEDIILIKDVMVHRVSFSSCALCGFPRSRTWQEWVTEDFPISALFRVFVKLRTLLVSTCIALPTRLRNRSMLALLCFLDRSAGRTYRQVSHDLVKLLKLDVYQKPASSWCLWNLVAEKHF